MEGNLVGDRSIFGAYFLIYGFREIVITPLARVTVLCRNGGNRNFLTQSIAQLLIFNIEEEYDIGFTVEGNLVGDRSIFGAYFLILRLCEIVFTPFARITCFFRNCRRVNNLIIGVVKLLIADIEVEGDIGLAVEDDRVFNRSIDRLNQQISTVRGIVAREQYGSNRRTVDRDDVPGSRIAYAIVERHRGQRLIFYRIGERVI